AGGHENARPERRPYEPSENARPEQRPYEPSANAAPVIPVPVSIHDLDTTPRETRVPPPPGGHINAKPSAPPPSPYEVTNPDSDSPKGGWWRKLTGQ
ncbi:MAG: hypothetical protein WCD70_11940, partial [Alphaproteobacteria bacterium]